MTLILTLGNSEQVIQISDRRLTVNSKLKDDESNKAGILICGNARLAFGFTGLSQIWDFKTRPWLLSALEECSPPDYTIGGILDRLKKKATRDFHTLPALRSIPQSNKRLSVMFSGYLYNQDPPLVVCALLSNFQGLKFSAVSRTARDEFECTYYTEKRPTDQEISLVQRVGFWPAMNNKDVDSLRKFLKELRPAKAITGKAVEIMRTIADRPQAEGKIGKQLSSISLPSDITMSAETDYYSNVLAHEVYMPDMIVAVNDKNQSSFTGISLQAVDPANTPPMEVPKVGRNQPCPCGSGKRYKWCHGRKKN